MTDAAIAETSSMPPGPEAVERPFSPDLGKTTPEVVSEGEASLPSEADARAALEIEYPIGSTRQAILDHFLDSDSPEQSMNQIKAGLPNVLPGTVEACVLREYRSGRLERVSAGVYRLAAKPPEQPKPAPQPEPDKPDDEWFAALEAWINDPETWDRERFGPRPDEPGRRIPAGVVAKGVDRNRKRAARRKEAEAAQARQAAADRELRDRLFAATGGNFQPGPGLDDVAPIRAAMELVPLDRIMSSIRSKTDKKMYPRNEPATSWRESRLLKEIAESYCRTDIVPRLVDAWSKAGKVPTPTARASSLPPVGEMLEDIDELRSHHDDPHAPPGPHNLPQPAAAPSVAPVDAAERAEPENASALSPAPMAVPSGEDDLAATRAAIAANLARARPESAPPPQPPEV
jgi:hypothetical protein